MLLRWLRRALSPKSCTGRRNGRASFAIRRRPFLEILEDRLVPASLAFGDNGHLLTSVQIVPVFFGPSWSNNLTSYPGYANYLNGFDSRIVNSSYIDQLQEYSVQGQAIGRGTFAPRDITTTDFNTAQTQINNVTYTTISNGDITKMLGDEIANGDLPTPDGNRLYMVYIEPNVAVIANFNDKTGMRLANSVQDFTGYHESSTDHNGNTYYYGIVVDPTGYPGKVPKGAPSGLTPLQYDTIVTSHELAEAITDADTVNGWRDRDPNDGALKGDEIGDLTQDTVLPGNAVGYLLDGYAVQREWSNNAGTSILQNENFVLSGTTLTVRGGQGDSSLLDTMTVSEASDGSIDFTVNGHTVHFGAGTVTSITIDPSGALDTIHVVNVAVPINISGNQPVTLDVDAGMFSGGVFSMPNNSNVFVASGATFNVVVAATLGSLTGSGTVNLGTVGHVNVGGDNSSSTFGGTISGDSASSGAEALNKFGAGTFTLTGNSTYSGQTHVLAGKLVAHGLPNSTVVVDSGATVALDDSANFGNLSGAGTVMLSASQQFVISLNVGNNNTSTTFSGNITGFGHLFKFGTGTLTLSGNNSYQGQTTVIAGTLRLGSPNAQENQAVFVGAGATLDVEAEPIVGGLSGAGTVILGKELFLGESTSSTFSGTITGGGGLFKGGAGTLTLTGENSLFGLTEIGLGTLHAAAPDALGGPVQVDSAGTLDAGGGVFVDSLTGSGHVILEADLLFENGGTASFSGTLSGPGEPVLEGDGTQILSGNNTYTGATEILNNGTLRAGSANAFGNTSAMLLDSAGSTLDLNNFSVSLRSLGGSGRIFLGNATLTEGSGNSNDTFAGVISGSGGLTKVGTGTLTLNGFNNVFGASHVNGGTLVVNGGLGDVVLSAGATLGGTGFVENVSGFGTVSPGSAAATGQLATADLNLDHAALNVRLNGPDVGSGYDQVLAFGNVFLDGTATLNVTAGFNSPIGTVFTIIDSSAAITGSASVNGAFAGLPDGALLHANGQVFRINYTMSDGDPVVTLTHVGASVQIDASALGTPQNPTPLFLDGVQQTSTVVTADLLAGQHSFASLGGVAQNFDINPDGSINLVNQALGTVDGNKLTITGIALSIDASALGTPDNPTPLFLDGVLQASTTIAPHLLPGPHAFASLGGVAQFFKIEDNGTITLDNPALGTVDDSTNTLTITGILVNIDASALGTADHPTPLFLDGILQASTTIAPHLLPGPHAFASLGGVAQFFDVGFDNDGNAMVSLVNHTLGNVTGNTNLAITGIAMTIDARALGMATLFVDGVALDATNPIPINLLPGLHSFSTAASTGAHYFDIHDDGTITLVNPLDGTVDGNLLTITHAG
jgi:autotransporter-associated beta strand protein